MPRCSRKTTRGYGFALGSVALAVGLRFALDPFLGTAFPYETLYLAILITAWHGGFRPALAAVVLGALTANYFFVVPRWSFQLAHPEQQVGLGLFIFIGVGLAKLSGSMHAERRRAEEAATDLQRQSALTDEAHDAVKAERDWFERIVSTAPVIICSFRLNPDGTTYFPFASPAIEAIYGLRPQELAEDASPIFSRMHPEDAGRVRATIETSARELSPWRCEFRVRGPGGKELWVEGHSIPSLEPDGAIVWQGCVADITDRKLSETALRDRERLLGTVTSSARVGLVVVDARYRYRFANEAYAEIFGLDPGGIVDRRVPELLPAAWTQIQPRLDRALAGERVSYELALPPSPGAGKGERNFSVVYEPRPGDGGEPTVVVVVVDITERKHVDEALRESEGRYRTLFEYAPDGIIIADSKGYYLDCNESICRMFEYTRGEFIGLHASDIVVPAEIEQIEKALTVLNSKADHQREWQFRRKNGSTFSAEVIATMMPDGRVMAMIRDITERKQVEEARDLFRALLDRSDDAIEVIDPEDGLFLDGNEMAWRSLGYSREEFLSLRVFDIDTVGSRHLWNERMEVLRRTGVLVFETTRRRKDGSIFPVEVNARYVHLNRDYKIAVVRDISERKRADGRLAAQYAVTRILAASPSLEEAARQMLEALCQNFGWERGEMWRVDGETRTLDCLLAWQQTSRGAQELDVATAQLSFAPGVGLPGRVWERRAAVWIPDVAQDPGFLRTSPAVSAGLLGAVGFPIMLGDLVMGVFCFYDELVDEPDEDLSRILTALGSQIGQFMERKRAETELSTSEERFRQLAENIREVFWLNDPVNQQTLYVSPAYETIWGRESTSLYASPNDWLESIHPEDRAWVAQASQRQDTVGGYDVEYRIVRPDGTTRWIHDRGFPVRNEAGEVYRVAGVAEDITAHRVAEAASQLQQSRLEGIVNSAMDGIITVGEDQCILLINAAAERMFGCRSEEVLGERVERFMPERFRQGHAAHVLGFGKTGVAARAMGRFGPISGIRSSGEEFPIEASISQIQVDGKKLFTVTCRDVTERVQAAETQKKLEAQLQQSQKMEAFGQLAGGVAHDFNNLLTVICGYSEWLLTYLPPYAENIDMIREINKAGERAAALTRQLLAFSRLQLIEPKVLNLNFVVDGVEKMLRRMIGEDVLLATALRPHISPVKIDPGQIEQVLMNLAVNARDAMPYGGKLTIETSDIELDDLFAKSHTETAPGRYVLLAVSDTGSGMSPAVKERIFEPFFTTKGVGKGTGLGLAVVHGIVKQNHGILQVYSELGVGTTFKIYLPAVDETSVDVVADDRSEAPRGTETILLVEDEEAVRDLTALALGEFGYTVLTAPGGDEALRLMEGMERSIDLLITDVVMPELSGRELAELLWTRHRDLKVLFVSGYTDDVVVRHGVLQADVAFLHKPFTLNALARKVREVLDS